MAQHRSVRQVVPAQTVDMGGIPVDQALPYSVIDQIDPFLLIHHLSSSHPGGAKPENLGIGPHPHRGFSPVTFIFKGDVHHRDSEGNNAIVEAGGTQWMHSGSGLLHSERPSPRMAREGGEGEIIQFWVNVPATRKMVAPSYQPLTAEATPRIPLSEGKVDVGLVAGSLLGKTGPIQTESDLLIARLTLQAGGVAELPIPASYNALIYQLSGEITVDGKVLGDRTMAWFNNDGTGIHIEATANSRVILLSGEPIGEPVVSYGPFVMNTQREIMQALEDFQHGRMGSLIEDFS